MARHYLESGKIFKLTFRANISKEWHAESLREINSSPTYLEEAYEIVETEHGKKKLPYLESMLKAQKVVDTLGVELDIHVFVFVHVINNLTKGNNIEKMSDRIIQEYKEIQRVLSL